MTQTIRSVGLFSVAVAFIFTLTLFRFPASAEDLEGTVISMDGKNVTIETEIVKGLSPAPGDSVDLMKLLRSPDGNELEFSIGLWQVTEVKGVFVKAVPLTNTGNPEINMMAVIHLSREMEYEEQKEEQESVWVPGSPRSPQ